MLIALLWSKIVTFLAICGCSSSHTAELACEASGQLEMQLSGNMANPTECSTTPVVSPYVARAYIRANPFTALSSRLSEHFR
jgi:hypothetical protein